MERKIIDLEHVRLKKSTDLKHELLRKRDEEMDELNKIERSVETLLESILDWKGCSLFEEEIDISNYPNNIEEQPEFVRIAKEIDEMGIDNWILENARERELIEERNETWRDI